MGLLSEFVLAVRAAVGLPADKGQPPDLMRLGLYRATVLAQNGDGTLDVQPEDTRIAGEKNVMVRAGIPGAVATVATGAVVLLGWERGDPQRPYCAPHWENGATVTKLVVNAQAVYLGAEGGSEAFVKKSEFNNHTHTVTGSCPGGSGGPLSAGAAAAPSGITGTTQVFGV